MKEAYQSRDAPKLLCESPRRRRIEESLRGIFLSKLPEEEWEQYQDELERKTSETWMRVSFMESIWDIIQKYGTQSVMRVGLNQPIMLEVIEKMVESTESDGLTESVTEESAEESPIMRDQSNRRTKKGRRKYKSMVRKKLKKRVVRSKAATVVMSIAKVSRLSEVGQGDGAMHSVREKKNQVPSMLLTGLISTASKAKKSERTLADTRQEMEVIS